jgi:hypothetical protein
LIVLTATSDRTSDDGAFGLRLDQERAPQPVGVDGAGRGGRESGFRQDVRFQDADLSLSMVMAKVSI